MFTPKSGNKVQVLRGLYPGLERWWDVELEDINLCKDITDHLDSRVLAAGNVQYHSLQYDANITVGHSTLSSSCLDTSFD